MKTEWTNVNVPKKLAERISEVIKYYGYKSVSDFVQDAVRRRVEHLELEIDVRYRRKEIEEE